jgi:hypothetical protein
MRRAEPLGLLEDVEAELERIWRGPFSLWQGPLLRRSISKARALTWTPPLDVYVRQLEIEGEDLVIRGEVRAENPGQPGALMPFSMHVRQFLPTQALSGWVWRARGARPRASRGNATIISQR